MKEAINADPVDVFLYLPLFLLPHAHPIASASFDVCEVGLGAEKLQFGI
jgi:hypothetical protein